MCATTAYKKEHTIGACRKKYFSRCEVNKLRQARLRADKTQLQLMKETGIYFATISKIERSWLKPSEQQKQKLAKALKVGKRWLFPD